jgi:hypothetical protein
MAAFCPVCCTQVREFRFEQPDGARVECPVCGTYRVSEETAQRLPETRIVIRQVIQPNRRLSAVLRQAAKRGEEPVLTDPEALQQTNKPAADLLEVIDRIMKYIRSKSPPGGNEFVPLIGHRDYAIGGAEDPEAFDHALGQADALGHVQRQAPNEAAYRLTPAGWGHLRTLSLEAKSVRSSSATPPPIRPWRGSYCGQSWLRYDDSSRHRG